MKFVSIIMGSKSDYDVVSEAAKVLEKFNVPYELIISSAHRSERANTSPRPRKRARRYLSRLPAWQRI